MDNLEEDEAVKMCISGSPSLKVTHCDAVVEFVKVAVPIFPIWCYFLIRLLPYDGHVNGHIDSFITSNRRSRTILGKKNFV